MHHAHDIERSALRVSITISASFFSDWEAESWLSLWTRLREGTTAHSALQVSVETFSGTTPDRNWRMEPGKPENSCLHGVTGNAA